MDQQIIQALLAAFAQQNGQNVGQQPSDGNGKSQNGRKKENKVMVPPAGSRPNVLNYMDNGSGSSNQNGNGELPKKNNKFTPYPPLYPAIKELSDTIKTCHAEAMAKVDELIAAQNTLNAMVLGKKEGKKEVKPEDKPAETEKDEANNDG